MQPNLLLVLGLMLFLPVAARAEIIYQIQPILKLGDQVGDIPVKTDPGHFEFGTLNDNGQLIFSTDNANAPPSMMLLQYADGRLTPLVVAGGKAPVGEWTQNVDIRLPMSMNRLGNVVFAADVTTADGDSVGTFLWDYQARALTAVALAGMPAGDNLTLENGGGFTPTINNRNEIALAAAVRSATGDEGIGIFFRGEDGKLLPVALPGQSLPDGGKLDSAFFPCINDAGRIAFLAIRQGDDAESAYLWENGTISPLLLVGTQAPGGGAFARITGIRINNKNRNALVAARVDDSSGPDGLYLLSEGKMVPVAVPGQKMPDGGQFMALQKAPITGPTVPHAISYANEAGQHAILAALEDDSTAAYLMDGDGKLSRILRSGTSTELGLVTSVGRATVASAGIGLNTHGQVAVVVQFGEDGPDTLVLLTPRP